MYKLGSKWLFKGNGDKYNYGFHELWLSDILLFRV